MTLAAGIFLAALCLAGCGDDGNGGGGAAAYDLKAPAALVGGGFDYDLTIAFTNDLHDQVLPLRNGRGGMARQATLLDLMRAEAAQRGRGFLAVNAGDNFEGSLFYDAAGGVTMLRLLETAGWDVIQVGNHDHQFGAQWLYDRLKAAFPGFTQNARFMWGNVNPSQMSAIGTDPALAGATFLPAQVDQEVIDAFENAFTNFATGAVDPTLMDAPTANSKVFNQTLFYERNGIRIGLFGIDTDEALYSSVPGEGDLFLDPSGKSENLRFYGPVTSTYASDMITYLNDPDQNAATDDGADIIIAVTHTGFAVDQMIAAAAVGATGRRIDVIVGGHSHTKLNTSVTVPHAGGAQTIIVQSGSKGEFVGRLDLSVDRALNRTTVRQATLLQVDDRLADDAAAAALIGGAKTGAGGVDAQFGMPYDTVLAQNSATLEGGVAAISGLGNLTTDGCLAAANAPGLALNLDAILIGNFVFRSNIEKGPVTIGDVQEVLPLHLLDRTGLSADGIDVIEFRGGLREALDPSFFPIPGPNLTNITELEYFLEIAFGIKDILTTLSSFLGISIAGIDDFVNGLQWAGITFTVDTAAPVMQRIDPSTIQVGGVPLVGNENRAYRIGISSVLARIAVPFFQILTQTEDPPGSGSLQPFPTYDPTTAATPIVTWQALRDRIAALGTITPQTAPNAVTNRPRTVAADMVIDPSFVSFSPQGTTIPGPIPFGGTANVVVGFANLGVEMVGSCEYSIDVDTTPADATDNPDGITDQATGAAFTTLLTGQLSLFSGSATGITPIQLPTTLLAGTYPVYVTIRNVQPIVGGTPEVVTANNGGFTYPATTIVVQ